MKNQSEYEPASYWLTRVLFLRFLAFIYLVAFCVAFEQNEALLGENGLTPAIAYIKQSRDSLVSSSGNLSAFLQLPTVFWFLAPTSNNLASVALIGALLSSLVIIKGAANMLIMSTLWLFYMSIVNVGQTWYSFGWESQLLETGFLAIFMVPFVSLNIFPALTPTPFVCIWGCRWLLFRIMLGAGLIKIRGDSCWLDLTCMQYHYQTQPVPNPLSIYFHTTPNTVHSFETFSNHLIELVIPWMTFFPRTPRLLCGLFQVFFQIVLILSGNLSFLNWLTIAPALMYFDDESIALLFSKRLVSKAKAASLSYQRTLDSPNKSTQVKMVLFLRRTIGVMVAMLIAILSVPVVRNLLSSEQVC